MATVTLQDTETGLLYKIIVTADEAKRMEYDLIFATKKLKEAVEASQGNKSDFTSVSGEIAEAEASYINIRDNTDEAGQAFKWPHEAVMLLIEEYRVREADFTNGKISQKRVWEAISRSLGAAGYIVTGPQCISKFGGLKRTYKSVKDHNKKSGNGPRSWPYMNVMDDLLSKKPYMDPVATTSSSGKRSISESSTSTISSEESSVSTPKKPRQISLTEELLEQRKLAEEARERRHAENLAIKNRLLQTFEKVVELLQNKQN